MFRGVFAGTRVAELWHLKRGAMTLPCRARLFAIAIAGLPLVASPPSPSAPPAVQAKQQARVDPAETRVPFRAGEKLDYRVLWSKFSINAASLRLSVVERRPFYGREAWHFQAMAHTTDSMRLLFALDDQFDSYAEPAALVSRQYEMYLREQGKQEDSVFRMTADGDPVPGAGSTVRVLPGTRDPLGLLYYLRMADWQHTREARAPVFDGKKLYEARARLEVEGAQVSIPAGNYVASKIEVRIYDRGVEEAQTRFWVWLAQDAARTPILIEAEIPFGSARVELTQAQPSF
jgi:hypothetical protein